MKARVEEEKINWLLRREEELHYQIRWAKEDYVKRLEATFKQCPETILRCDFHSHSRYSDGKFSLKEMQQWRELCGIDYLAATDHDTLAQREEVQSYPHALLGEEITIAQVEGIHPHLLGIGISEVIEPDCELLEGIEKIYRQGGFPILAHPCGWYRNDYPEVVVEAIEKKLLELNSPFGLEVGNAAANLFNYFDRTDAAALALWDRLLSAGKHVLGFGNSDAHHGCNLGVIWTGLIGPKPNKQGIYQVLNKGHHFLSDGPVVILESGGVMMGETVVPSNSTREFMVRVYDQVGIWKVRVIKNGSLFKQWNIKGEKQAALSFEDIFEGNNSYYRVDCFTVDGKRAYSNPIWVGL